MKMKVAIWGDGKFGKMICNDLLSHTDHEIVCVIDRNAEKDIYTNEFGITVVDLSRFESEYLNHIDVVLVAITQFEFTLEQLNKWKSVIKCGVVKGRVLDLNLSLEVNLLKDSNVIWDDDFGALQLPVLKHLQTNVVDACNLNCKGCSHFAQLFDKNSIYQFEQFDNDVRQMASKVMVLEFALLGGEIFMLYDELEKYIRSIKKHMSYTSIIIYTNGILIPRQSDRLLKFIKDNGVFVFVTEYLPAQKMHDQIEETLRRYGIAYTISSLKDQFGKNIELQGDNDPYIAQAKCRQVTCQFIRMGKLYKCPFSALGNVFFKYYSIPLHFDEGIDIYDEAIDWEYVTNTIRTNPIEQCKYCGTEEKFAWAISNKPEAEEWII